MNRKIGMYGALINLIAVICFAVSMLLELDYVSYFCSMLIALSFVAMMCVHAHLAPSGRRAAGYCAAAFAAAYAAVILLVYFAQLTTVRFGGLSPEAERILDFQSMGLFFNFDLLGYALMALSTFFAGLTVRVAGNADKWLRALLLIHGVFFISCIAVPMLGVFTADAPKFIGVALLEVWCLYFCPVGILSYSYFKRIKN